MPPAPDSLPWRLLPLLLLAALMLIGLLLEATLHDTLLWRGKLPLALLLLWVLARPRPGRDQG